MEHLKKPGKRLFFPAQLKWEKIETLMNTLIQEHLISCFRRRTKVNDCVNPRVVYHQMTAISRLPDPGD